MCPSAASLKLLLLRATALSNSRVMLALLSSTVVSSPPCTNSGTSLAYLLRSIHRMAFLGLPLALPSSTKVFRLPCMTSPYHISPPVM